MGKDRQEKKMKKAGRVETDRDQRFSYQGATLLEDAESARKRNQ